MKYFKNIEISREFAVNPTTVQNWIDLSIEGKNSLQLVKINKRNYIIDNSHNILIIEQLVNSSRKYKHKSQRKIVTANKDFFAHFSNDQIADIINSIELHSEIPHKYTYVNRGALIWNNYVIRTLKENLSNTITNTDTLLKLSFSLLKKELKDFDKVNIVDIGCGEISPVRWFLEQLLELDLIKNYTAVDISQSMLNIAENNLNSWFGNKLKYEFVKKDINHSAIEDLLFYNAHQPNSFTSKNLVLFLGSTIENQLDYIRTLINIASSLGKNDLFLIGVTLDNQTSKVFFDFSSKQNSSQVEYLEKEDEYKDWQDFIIPHMLGLSTSDFEVELFYNEEEKSRMTQLICNKDITINIKNDKIDTTINLFKGQKITTWRHRHHTMPQIIQVLDNNGLLVKHCISSSDEAHALIICKRK